MCTLSRVLLTNFWSLCSFEGGGPVASKPHKFTFVLEVIEFTTRPVSHHCAYIPRVLTTEILVKPGIILAVHLLVSVDLSTLMALIAIEIRPKLDNHHAL